VTKAWGGHDAWHRAAFVWVGLLWLFREEFPALDRNQLRWLPRILADAKQIAEAQARICETREDAFGGAVRLLVGEIRHRLRSEPDDPELTRLLSIAGAARCSDPLRQPIFSVLRARSAKIYREPRAASLAVGWLNRHPLGQNPNGTFRDPYHVSARTRLLTGGASVGLDIHLDQFDFVSLLAVPAILVHELVCHAHAAVHPQDRADTSGSWWAEGFMDWTAHYFFERWLSASGLPYELVKKHGEQLWRDRMFDIRHTGWQAADTLVGWLIDEPAAGERFVAESIAAELALQVNAVCAQLARKDWLASELLVIRTDTAVRDKVRAWMRGDLSPDGLLPEDRLPDA